MPETTGTITVTNGSTAITGSGTLFSDNFVGANDALVVGGEIYIVKSVSSNTALTLLTPYTGTSGSGKSYVIIHLTGEDVINLLARKTTELVEKYGLIANSITETPGAGGIPQADDNGKLADGWLYAATESKAGIAEIATAAEVAAGTDNARIVTPQRLAEHTSGIINWARHTYTERDLTTVFASEISGYSDVWAWIKARITAVNWDGLMIGDYIPFQMNGQTVKAQIAGIDTYYGVMDQTVGHHIDFISRNCFNSTMKWNTTNTNQGTASENSPWLASNAYSVLNTTWYNYLPAALKSVIVEKRFLIENRYSSSGAITASNGWKWANIGKLWLPSVYEIAGSNVWGTQGYSEGHAVQYPIFANSWQYRRKGAGNGGGRCDWWTLTPSGVSSAEVCYVGNNGFVYYSGAAGYEFREPVCFRIS